MDFHKFSVALLVVSALGSAHGLVCFNCDTTTKVDVANDGADWRCADPFGYHRMDTEAGKMISTVGQFSCVVCRKYKSYNDDGEEFIARSCLADNDLDIQRARDHLGGCVAASEDGQHGQVCYCSDDYCNHQASSHSTPLTCLLACLLAGRLLAHLN